MGKSPERTGRIVTKQISLQQAWGRGSPRAEAAVCLKAALRNGGLASMRALIGVSEQERAELLAWAADEPKLVERIEQAVAFREAVLREFDKLAAA